MSRAWRRIILFCLFIFAAVVFLTGIHWGLPSREADRMLFGTEPVWSGRKIYELAGGWDEGANRGADVTRRPLENRDRVLWVNETDAQKAAIMLRYRLYSCQPDEASTV